MSAKHFLNHHRPSAIHTESYTVICPVGIPLSSHFRRHQFLRLCILVLSPSHSTRSLTVNCQLCNTRIQTHTRLDECVQNISGIVCCRLFHPTHSVDSVQNFDRETDTYHRLGYHFILATPVCACVPMCTQQQKFIAAFSIPFVRTRKCLSVYE